MGIKASKFFERNWKFHYGVQYIEKEKKVKKGPWMDVAKFLGFGWYVAVSILLGTWVGVWLDRKLQTAPWLTLVGLLAGLVVAFWGAYRMFAPLIKEGKDDKKKGGKE